MRYLTEEVLEYVHPVMLIFFSLNEQILGGMKAGKRNANAFFLMLRKLMTSYRGMGYGMKCENGY